MRWLRRSWVLAVLLVLSGPALAVDVPRVMIAGNHIGNAFLRRPNTHVWVPTGSGVAQLLGLRFERNPQAPQPPRFDIRRSTVWPAAAVLLLGVRRIARRMKLRQVQSAVAAKP